MTESRRFIIFFVVLGLIQTVYAQPQLVSAIVSPLTYVLCLLFRAIVQIAGAAAALIFVFAGVRYIMGADDPGARKAAKETMKHVLIGMIIIACAAAIVYIVLGPDYANVCG